MDDKKLKTVPLNKIKISDQFWNRYIHLVKDVLIPYQWDILNDRLPDVETSHCIENFKIAAGETDGDFEGAVFQDTDVAKWLEAVAYSLAAEPDEHLSYLADKTINLIGRAQCEDGYLNTYFTIKDPSKRWTNLKEGHELYTAGHMTEAAVAYYKATGKTEFLDIMKKFADLICKTFGPDEGQIHGYPGHQEIELALIRLYHVTGEKKYLETAKYFIDTRGVGENYFLEEEKRPEYKQIFPEFAGYDPRYSQSHEPVREQKTAEGHAVRAVYMYCAMADLAYEYKDKELLDACKTLWEDMTKRQMYITGSIGASGLLERFTTDYDLPNNCNYSETCASIGLALFGRRMAQITKDASYMDVVERALYNTLLSGIAQDGKSFFYVNPLEVWPDNEEAYPEYNSGNFAVQIMPFWQTSRFTNYMSDLEGKIAIAAPPVFGDNDAVKTIGGGGTGTAVVKSSKNADLAAEVFAYIKLSEDANKEVWNVLGFDPVNTSVWTDTDLTQNPDNQFVKYFKTKPFDTLLELQDSIGGLNSYTSSKYPSINNEFCTTTLNNIFEEGMDVKDALKQSQETLENEFGDK